MVYIVLKEQSQLIWKLRDGLQKEVSNQAMKILLELNGQNIPPGESKVECKHFCLVKNVKNEGLVMMVGNTVQKF